MLKLVPCNHYFLAVHYGAGEVISICNKCKKKFVFSNVEWEQSKAEGVALDKPKRI